MCFFVSVVPYVELVSRLVKSVYVCALVVAHDIERCKIRHTVCICLAVYVHVEDYILYIRTFAKTFWKKMMIIIRTKFQTVAKN